MTKEESTNWEDFLTEMLVGKLMSFDNFPYDLTGVHEDRVIRNVGKSDADFKGSFGIVLILEGLSSIYGNVFNVIPRIGCVQVGNIVRGVVVDSTTIILNEFNEGEIRDLLDKYRVGSFCSTFEVR